MLRHGGASLLRIHIWEWKLEIHRHMLCFSLFCVGKSHVEILRCILLFIEKLLSLHITYL